MLEFTKIVLHQKEVQQAAMVVSSLFLFYVTSSTACVFYLLIISSCQVLFFFFQGKLRIWACDNKINTVHWEELSCVSSGNAPSVIRPAAMRLILPWRRYRTAPRGPEGRSRDQSNLSHRRCRQSPRNIKWEARCVSAHWKCKMWWEMYFHSENKNFSCCGYNDKFVCSTRSPL